MDEGAPAKVQHVRIELQTPRNNVSDLVAKLQGEGEEFGAAAVSKEEGRNLPNSCADRCQVQPFIGGSRSATGSGTGNHAATPSSASG